MDDALGELFIDGSARYEEPIEQRSTEHIEGELDIEVGSQIASLNAALEHGAQGGAAAAQKAMPDGPRKVGTARHGFNQARHDAQARPVPYTA